MAGDFCGRSGLPQLGVVFVIIFYLMNNNELFEEVHRKSIDPLWSRVQVRQAYWLSIQNVNTPIARVWVRIPNFSLKAKITIFDLFLQKSNFRWISSSVMNQAHNSLINELFTFN